MSDHLSAPQREELRHALLDERARLVGRGVELSEDEPDPGDRQDLPTEEARLRTDFTLSAHDRQRLAEIDGALARMEQGSYGICEETGEPIPFARLRIEPTTRFTVEALELLEAERARDRLRDDDDDDRAY